MPVVLAVGFSTGVRDAWSHIATAIPKFVLFLVILLLAFLIARALAKITKTVLRRIGFDRAVERGGIQRALAHSRYDASDLLAKIVYYAVLLIGLSMAFGVFGPNPISDYLRAVVAYLPRLVVAIVIVVIAAAIARVVRDLVGTVLSGLPYGAGVATAASALILVIGIFAALNQLDIAQTVVNATYIALLVAIVGVTVIGVGGGLVEPMRHRWERWLSRAEDEAPRAREAVRNRPTPPPPPYPTVPATPTEAPAGYPGDYAFGDFAPGNVAAGDFAPTDVAPGEYPPGDAAPGERSTGDYAPPDRGRSSTDRPARPTDETIPIYGDPPLSGGSWSDEQEPPSRSS